MRPDCCAGALVSGRAVQPSDRSTADQEPDRTGRSAWKWAVAALLVLLLGAAALLYRAGWGEAAAGADAPRPRRAPGVVLALDGVGVDVLTEVLEAGYAPTLSSLPGEPAEQEDLFTRGSPVSDVLSVLPSTTYRGWASVFTGEPAGWREVPGNEWCR